MKKLNEKAIAKHIEANCVCHNSKGITLIALIITIIVMIILVGVTVTIAINGGLFKTAQEAALSTTVERDREILQTGVASAKVSKNGITTESLKANLPEEWIVEGDGTFTVTSPNKNVFTVTSEGVIIQKDESEETRRWRYYRIK